MIVDIVDGRPVGYMTCEEAAEKWGYAHGSAVSQMVKNNRIKSDDVLKICCNGYGKGHIFIFIREDTVNPKDLVTKEDHSSIVRAAKEKVRREKCKNYPLNLIEALGLATDIPEDFLADVIERRLTPRENEVIKHLYQEGLTLDETGKIYDVTRERIRQIKYKALRKIRHFVRLSKRNSEIQTREGHIEELGLSVRTYNALLRSGIKEIEQLLHLSYGQVMDIRGVGMMTACEILGQVHACGYKFDWEN